VSAKRFFRALKILASQVAGERLQPGDLLHRRWPLCRGEGRDQRGTKLGAGLEGTVIANDASCLLDNIGEHLLAAKFRRVFVFGMTREACEL
jgi:hypothetical protein